MCRPLMHGKYRPKMIRPCDWTFETKVIIVYGSVLKKIHFYSLLSFIVVTNHSQSMLVYRLVISRKNICIRGYRAKTTVGVFHLSRIVRKDHWNEALSNSTVWVSRPLMDQNG